MNEIFYSTTHSTHFIYDYMVKDHSNRERERDRKPAATTTWSTLFRLAATKAVVCDVLSG